VREAGFVFRRSSGDRAVRVSTALALLLLAVGAGLAGASGVAGEDEDSRDQTLTVERIRFNQLANASFESSVTTGDVGLPQWLVVSNTTDTTPIEVTTAIPHELESGEAVAIKGVRGNTAANGWWTITVRTVTTFSLDGSAGNGSFAGGGSIFPAAGQPRLPGVANEFGDPVWTPWFSGPAAFPATEFFQSDGVGPTAEVYSIPRLFEGPEPVPVNSFASQEIDGSRFRPGERLCLSIEAKVSQPASDRQKLTMIVTAALGTVRVYRASFPGPQLTDQYQRFSLCFTLDPNAITDEGVVRVEFIDELARGASPRPMFWARPMLSEGSQPAPWTASVDPIPRTHPFY
jgi:hypothetical protein